VELLDIHPNVQVVEPLFPLATLQQHLHIAVPTLHVMQGAKTAHLPMRQFVNPMVWLQSNHLILVQKLFLQYRL
jgi:hypothetical protein